MRKVYSIVAFVVLSLILQACGQKGPLRLPDRAKPVPTQRVEPAKSPTESASPAPTDTAPASPDPNTNSAPAPTGR